MNQNISMKNVHTPNMHYPMFLWSTTRSLVVPCIGCELREVRHNWLLLSREYNSPDLLSSTHMPCTLLVLPPPRLTLPLLQLLLLQTFCLFVFVCLENVSGRWRIQKSIQTLISVTICSLIF